MLIQLFLSTNSIKVIADGTDGKETNLTCVNGTTLVTSQKVKVTSHIHNLIVQLWMNTTIVCSLNQMSFQYYI